MSYLVVKGHSGILSVTLDFAGYNLDYAVDKSIEIAKMLVDPRATVKFTWREVVVTIQRNSDAKAIIKAVENAPDGREVGP